MIDHAPYFLVNNVFHRSCIALNDRGTIRLFLALAASVLFHTLLLETWISAIHHNQAALAENNRLTLNVLLAEKQNPLRKAVRQTTTSGHPKNTNSRKNHQPLDADGQKSLSLNRLTDPVPDSPVSYGMEATQATGAALSSMMSRQYMMMRLQQFFSVSRESANKLVTGHFTADKMAHYHDKHCSLRLMSVTAQAQGYEIVQPECDDPELTAEMQTIPWNTAMPLPSGYSLPYLGLVIHFDIGSYDVSIGLEPITN